MENWELERKTLRSTHSMCACGQSATLTGLSAPCLRFIAPFSIYNLPQGAYLRSTASWNFYLAQNTYVIPLGAGFGKVFVQQSGTTINVFVEPQWTVAHEGVGQPASQIFAGVNLQFLSRRRPREVEPKKAGPGANFRIGRRTLDYGVGQDTSGGDRGRRIWGVRLLVGAPS